jgi:hypothetical protein
VGAAVAGAAAVGAAGAGAIAVELQQEYEKLAEDVQLLGHKQAISDLEGGIADLIEKIDLIRQRGYRYKNFLERKAATLQTKWAEAEPAVRSQLTSSESELQAAYNTLARRPVGAIFERGVADLRGRVNAANSTLDALYSSVRQTYYQTAQQVQQVIWMLDQADQFSDEFLANENLIQAVEAEWQRDGNEKPDGILYLTDQRLLFEQKEKVATKKVLFITTESEVVQALLLQVPVASVESVKASTKGMLGREDHLDFTFSSGDFVNAHFHIKGQDSEEWAVLVNRVLNGDIEQEKYYPAGVDAAAEQHALDQAMAEAPAQCTACGAPLDAQLVRGQNSIQCEYCGTVMRW